MGKITFRKSVCSHGVILCAYRNWSEDKAINDCVCYYIPIYQQFVCYDKDFSYLEKYLRSVHFDSQYDELKRFQDLHNYRCPNRPIELIRRRAN